MALVSWGLYSGVHHSPCYTQATSPKSVVTFLSHVDLEFVIFSRDGVSNHMVEKGPRRNPPNDRNASTALGLVMPKEEC